MSLNTTILLALTPLFIMEAFILFYIVPRWTAAQWQPLARLFPPVEPAPHAIRRNCQSFSLGMLNLGFSVNVAADEHHLHLSPARLGRWLRLAPVSIPWEEIHIPPRGRARIAGLTIHVPRWCRALAAREPRSA